MHADWLDLPGMWQGRRPVAIELSVHTYILLQRMAAIAAGMVAVS